MKELHNNIISTYEYFTEIRDKLMRDFGCDAQQFPAKEYDNRANEVSQIACIPIDMMDEFSSEIRLRLANSQLGIKGNRVDK